MSATRTDSLMSIGKRSRRRQRGAVAVVAAVATLLGLIAAALVIDVGRFYWAHRDLQRAANLAALDAARVAGGCLGVSADPGLRAYREVEDSLARNGLQQAVIDAVRLGREHHSENGLREFAEGAPGQTNMAVQVVLSRPMPGRLLPVAPRATGVLRASAAARSRPYAGVRVGARLDDVDADLTNALIGQVVGGTVYLSAGAYAALSEAQLPVGDVVDRLVDATDDETLTTDIPVSGMLHALVDALAQTSYSLAETATTEIADATQTASTLSPIDVVGIDNMVLTVAGDAVIGAGDLVMSSIQAASTSSLVEMSYQLPPPLGDSVLTLRYVQPGRQSVTTITQPGEDGSEEASSASGYVQSVSRVSVDALASDVVVPLWFELGGVRARVDEIQCARSGQANDLVYVQTSVAPSRIGIGRLLDSAVERVAPESAVLVDATLPVGLFGNAWPVQVRVSASGEVSLPAVQDELVFESPFETAQRVGDRYRVADALQQLPALIDLDVSVATESGLLTDEQRLALEQAVESTTREQLQRILSASADDFSRRVLNSAGLAGTGVEVRVYGVALKEPYVFNRGG